MRTDLRVVLRSFAKTPGFTAIAVLTLAVGIGATSAMYSALRALVMEPFSYPDQDQVVQVWPREDWAMGALDFLDLKEQSSSFQELGAYASYQANIGGEKVQAVDGARCTSGVLRSFGVPPAMGRWLEPSDEAKGAPAVAVISDGLWRQAFAADPGLIGRIVRVDGTDTTVVGIMPHGFEFASPWYRDKTCKIWTPLRIERGNGDRGSNWLCCVGRLKRGVSVAAADAEVKAIGARLAAAYPDTNTGKGFLVRPLKAEMTRFMAPMVWVLFGAVVMVLLVACLNVASMLLARNAMRQGEFGIRTALGATRFQIIRLILIESLLLAVAGSVIGALLAAYGARALALIAQTTNTRKAAIVIDGGVLVFTMGAAFLTTLVAGLPPAIATLRHSTDGASRGEGRGVAGSPLRKRLLRSLVVSQVAVAFALANVATLFTASYLKLLTANKGLATDFVLSCEVDLHGARYDKIEDRVRFAEQLADRASRLPGVTASGITTKLPLEGGSNLPILVNSEVFDPKINRPLTEASSITPGYFTAAGIRLLRGRTLERDDAGQETIGVVVNRTLADTCWPGQDPLGKIIRSDSAKPSFHARVVGVVESVRQWGPKTEPIPEIYWTLDRAWGPTIFLLVRSSQPAASLAPLLKRELSGLDKDLPMSHIRTLRELVRDGTQGDRAVAGVFDFFMATALGLVAVGLYGTLSYCVLQRTREIGIRMAVGAERGSILRLVFSQGFSWVVIGVALGAVGSLALAAGLRSLIWGIDPFNPISLIGSAVAVGAAGLLACWLPARRATRVDPMVALRFE